MYKNKFGMWTATQPEHLIGWEIVRLVTEHPSRQGFILVTMKNKRTGIPYVCRVLATALPVNSLERFEKGGE